VAWSGSAGAGVVHCRVCQVGGQGPTASACRRVHAARGSSRLRFRGRTLFDEPAEQFDDRERAGQIYRLLLAHADLFVCSGAGVIVIGGSVRYPLGIAAAAIGRLDDAIRHLRAAIDSGGGSPVPATRDDRRRGTQRLHRAGRHRARARTSQGTPAPRIRRRHPRRRRQPAVRYRRPARHPRGVCPRHGRTPLIRTPGRVVTAGGADTSGSVPCVS